MANYDINRPLRLGEVKTIRSDGGRKLEQAELLFSSDTIAQFNVNRETNRVDLLMDNTDFKYPDLNCALSKKVIKDIYIIFRDFYNELKDDESEENKKEPDPGELEGKLQEEILEGLPDGWTYTDNNGFVHVRDEQGRVRIDPPDKKTKYKHIHVYDENGNLLDVNGNPVSPKDPAGHIPIAD